MPFFPFYILSTYARLDSRRVLMLVLLFRNYNTLERHTFEQWSAILDLSTRWVFTSIRELAIRCMRPPDPLKKLLLARKCAVEEWTLPALLELCERSEPLSLEEARLMDFEDVLLVGSARQNVRSSTLTVDGTEIGNCIRAWKSERPGSTVPDPLNTPVRIHTPSGTLFPTMEPQPIFNGGSVSTQPARADDDLFWGGPKKKRGCKKR